MKLKLLALALVCFAGLACAGVSFSGASVGILAATTSITTGPAPPSSVVATVTSAPSTAPTFCVNVELADGASGAPIQSGEIDVYVAGELGPDINVDGTTDATGNGTFCFTYDNPLDRWGVSVSAALFDQIVYETGFTSCTQGFCPLVTNTLTVGRPSTFPPPPPISTPATTTSPAPTNAAPSTTSAAPTTTAPAVVATMSGATTTTAKTQAPSVKLLKLTKPHTVLLTGPNPRILLNVKVAKAAVAHLWLIGPKGSHLAHWTTALARGPNMLRLVLPEVARHMAHDEILVRLPGGASSTVPVTIKT